MIPLCAVGHSHAATLSPTVGIAVYLAGAVSTVGLAALYRRIKE